MRPLHTFSDRDLKLISAYIDAELSDRQARALLHRFDVEPELKQAYLEMKQTVRTLRGLKPLPVPRNFTVTPEMLGEKKRRAFPILQFATGLTALVFTILVGGDMLVHRFVGMSSNMDHLAPAMEMVAEVEIPNKVAGEAPVSEPRAVDSEVTAQESLGGATEMEPEAPMPAVVEEAVSAEDQAADHVGEARAEGEAETEAEAIPAELTEESIATNQVADESFFEENLAITGAVDIEADVEEVLPADEPVDGQAVPELPDTVSVERGFIQAHGLRILEFGLGALVLILIAVNVSRRTRFHR